MLGAGTQAADHQKHEERNETARGANAEKTDGREKRSGGQDGRLAPAFREVPRRDLEKGEGARVSGAQKADLREGEGELVRPHGEENVQEIGASVMQEVDDAACGERATSTLRDHDGDSFSRFSHCQARDSIYTPTGILSNYKVRFEPFLTGLPGFMLLTFLLQLIGLIRWIFVYNMMKYDNR